MEITEEVIADHIPYYLTEEQKIGLAKALKDFPQGLNYYTPQYASELLQGDGWNDLAIINFETVEKISIKGIILSNSCDISPENARDMPTNITFAPLMPLASYKRVLESSGLDHQKIDDKIEAITQQKITSLFYLPRGGELDADYIAVLGDVRSVPSAHFLGQATRKKQFTLSQAGFYLFVLKLSIHFCRFHEKVYRDEAPAV